jgi:hypothetical protein
LKKRITVYVNCTKYKWLEEEGEKIDIMEHLLYPEEDSDKLYIVRHILYVLSRGW